MIARLLRWLAGLFGGSKAPGLETTMIPVLMALLRGLGVDALGPLKKQGAAAVVAALKAALAGRRNAIIDETLRKLTADGTTAKLAAGVGSTDKDGDVMTARQFFVHEALYRICKIITKSGEAADLARDIYWEKHGEKDADALLAGITDGRVAVGKVLDWLTDIIL